VWCAAVLGLLGLALQRQGIMPASVMLSMLEAPIDYHSATKAEAASKLTPMDKLAAG